MNSLMVWLDPAAGTASIDAFPEQLGNAVAVSGKRCYKLKHQSVLPRTDSPAGTVANKAISGHFLRPSVTHEPQSQSKHLMTFLFPPQVTFQEKYLAAFERITKFTLRTVRRLFDF